MCIYIYMSNTVKSYFIDFDNTLCISKNGDYINTKPILERINYVNNLKIEGHKITIWTARGATTGLDFEELTKSQLKEWNIQYDELLMGKPHYDIYIDDKSFNVDSYWPVPEVTEDIMGNNIKTKKTESEIVEKGWGKEIIFVNNDEYCGKILCFNKGKKFSMHYHLKKKETWYVTKGNFILIWIDTEKGVTYTEYLNVGDTITNERGEPHQLIALEDSEVFEVSTKHYDADSFRMWKGD
jgi:mannose-6-phosphate isomerase-like protein (cupin superfamily)